MIFSLWSKSGSTDTQGFDVNSALELLDRLLSWKHYPDWQGIINAHRNTSPTVVMRREDYRLWSDWTVVIFDPQRKHDLEYVEMKIVELWDKATEGGTTP